jgi:xylan 1,4-beta-xylosidase
MVGTSLLYAGTALLLATVNSVSAFKCTGENQTSSYVAEISALGCYSDDNDRTLQGRSYSPGSLNTPQYCANLCGSQGYTYSGVEYSS